MKKLVAQLIKKVAPKKTDDLLWISIADPKQSWIALAREAYRFVKSDK